MPQREKPPVDRIRELLAQGVRQCQIVRRLGVSKQVVCKVAHGRYEEKKTT